MENETRDFGYYAIIPNEVMFDENLMANAKLLYGQITLLANKEGYCWASNAFFARKNKTSSQSISKWVSNLADNGYIKLEYEHAGTNVQRKIYLTSKFKQE